MRILRDAWQLTKKTAIAWWQDNTFRLGASLAFYTVFSLAPILLIAIAIVGFIFGEETARQEVVNEVRKTVGPTAADAVGEVLRNIGQTGGGWLATLLSIGFMVVGATAVFVELQGALNTVWGVKPHPQTPIWATVKDRFVSFGLVLAIGFLLLVSLVVSTGLSVVETYLTSLPIPGGVYVWRIVNFLVSVAVVTVLFALIFKVLPDVEMTWPDVWVGALVTSLLFNIGKYLIGLYLGQSAATSAFGAAGSLAVILLWVYYSSQIVLFGAEFTQVYANHYGKEMRPAENAVFMSEAEREHEGMEPHKRYAAVRDDRGRTQSRTS